MIRGRRFKTKYRTNKEGDVYPIGDRDKPGLSEVLDAEETVPDPREQPCAICGTPTIYQVKGIVCCPDCYAAV